MSCLQHTTYPPLVYRMYPSVLNMLLRIQSLLTHYQDTMINTPSPMPISTSLDLASWTCPDIAYSVVALIQWNASPTCATLLVAKGVLCYLSGTCDWWLEYGCAACNDPIAYSDVDWATNKQDRKSISGYAFFMFSGLVSWLSSKQKAIALSSTEAKYMAITHAWKEALWIKLFCQTIGLPFPHPFTFLSDSDSAISMTKSNVVLNCAKHINIRYHFIRDHITEGTIAIHWIPTEDMTADIFIKSLARPIHFWHSQALGLSVPTTTNQITQDNLLLSLVPNTSLSWNTL